MEGLGALAWWHAARSAEKTNVPVTATADANGVLLDSLCEHEALPSSSHGAPHDRSATKGTNPEVDNVDCGNTIVARKDALEIRNCQIGIVVFPKRDHLNLSVYGDVDVNPLGIEIKVHCCAC